ncbi:M42 family metallopeptidase [Sedimentibacter sp. MB31-C6]|uniref:M42 family metallopeptidase n=1 Tax=Sedimentibacter sp. MB31-C6 TaxID=3109366 RepID=UPI002DDD930B|nr:M20/M25/M40 family metallo-hydrolase [Sedimentibacter sp. MB36-C1]WSI05067.1 M20/M25/M40 family metallo-hydrolase [Sedimentibacter sp. MB36-C1]
MVDINLIRDLTNAFGPSGFEDDVVKVIKEYGSEFDIESDSMNNVFAKLRNNTGKKPIVMLDAHSDEVGFIVQHITSKGLLSILNVGGWINSNIPAHTVKIKNTKGEIITGVITSKPPHFMTDAERASDKLDLESIYIDVGATSRNEVVEDFGIQVGDPVMPDVTLQYNDKNGTLLGKAFDNRLGCVCIIETMKALLDNNSLAVDVVGGFASQEEVGMRGAQITSQVVAPDLAIVFEGSPADDLYYDEFQAQCALKKGVQIRHMDQSYISNTEYISYAKDLADKNGIKYQSAVRRRGSTNAGKIHLAHKAVPVLVLGIPSRYVHTHYNFCALEDINSTVDLAVEVIKNLNDNSLNKIFKR